MDTCYIPWQHNLYGVGATASMHNPTIAPKNNLLDYYNRKGYRSVVVLQALVHNK